MHLLINSCSFSRPVLPVTSVKVNHVKHNFETTHFNTKNKKRLTLDRYSLQEFKQKTEMKIHTVDIVRVDILDSCSADITGLCS